MRVPIGISNRHIHLTKSGVNKLFGEGYELQKLKDITQPGQFACQETVILQGPKGKLENVRVVGPHRKFSQVEIMAGDNYILGTNAPIKISGDIKDAENIKIIGPKGKLEINNCMIVSQRHLHCTVVEAQDMGIKDGDVIAIKINGIRGLIFNNVAVRARDDYALDFHIDIEEANASGVKLGDWGEIVK